ncbi:MAG: DapH/DapD/GlmU-related protein [Solirubrobacterales bacterium]
MSDLRPSDLAPGLLIGEDAQIGSGVRFGGHVIVHAGTRIADGCELADHAVVGRNPSLAPGSSASREQPPPTALSDGARVLAGAVVLAGARIGANAIVADQAHVRERASVGKGSVVGRGSAVDNDVTVGDRVRIQTGCYITAFSTIEDDVFVGPGVVTTNDHTMGRHGPERPLTGARLRRACRIGGGAVIAPGVEVGEEAFVAAGAVVVADVPPRAVVMGVPGRERRQVPDEDLVDRWR